MVLTRTASDLQGCALHYPVQLALLPAVASAPVALTIHEGSEPVLILRAGSGPDSAPTATSSCRLGWEQDLQTQPELEGLPGLRNAKELT